MQKVTRLLKNLQQNLKTQIKIQPKTRKNLKLLKNLKANQFKVNQLQKKPETKFQKSRKLKLKKNLTNWKWHLTQMVKEMWLIYQGKRKNMELVIRNLLIINPMWPWFPNNSEKGPFMTILMNIPQQITQCMN